MLGWRTVCAVECDPYAAVAFAQLADRAGLSIGRNTYEFARRKIESENAASARGERGAAPWATD